MLIIVKQPSFKARSNSWKENFFSAGLFSQSLGFFLKYVSKICFDSKCKWASLSNLIFKLTKEHRNSLLLSCVEGFMIERVRRAVAEVVERVA